MHWKNFSNLIITVILSIAYTIVTFLNIIGPLHMNATGGMNTLGWLSIYSLLYWLFALAITWGLYFYLRRKPELLFFILLVGGMAIIIVSNLLWGWVGS